MVNLSNHYTLTAEVLNLNSFAVCSHWLKGIFF